MQIMSMEIKSIRERYRYSRILLRQLVITDFKLRYQNSVLGYLWSLLKPLALFAILYLVFDKFLKVGRGINHYPLYLLLGIVLWNYFSEITNTSVKSIVSKGLLLRKINFPKHDIILASALSASINFFISLSVVLVFIGLSSINLSWSALLLPLLILELFVFSLGVGMILGTAYVRFRDVSYIWEVLLQAGFYATPILYPLTFVPSAAAKILILNPVAQIIQDSRMILIDPATITITQIYGSRWARIIPVLIALFVLLIGAYYFHAKTKTFAEDI